MSHRRLIMCLCGVLLSGSAVPARAQYETVLQYFNTSWTEIAERLPEIAEAGYSAFWLPSPSKGASGGFSVGYDTLDRFDLGDKDQAGTVKTRYGTRAELLALVEQAHRFGIRVYFDNIMAHNGGPLDAATLPGQLFPGAPGFVPQDFHLVRRNGQWAKASDSINWNDEWQVLNRNPFSWDIAQENPNVSFNPNGSTEGQTYAKWSGVRQPGLRWYYLDTDLPVATNGDGDPVFTFADKEPWQDVGWGASANGAGNRRFDWNDANGNGQHDVGETSEPFTDTGIDPSNPGRRTVVWGFGDGRYNMGNPVPEDVNAYLNRAARYVVDATGCDGFRLDAVKHVPSYFFGKQSGSDRDRSNWGYCGQIQEQFNITHGYSDWSNHRDTNFDLTLGRDDAVMWGEHLGAPPNPGPYVDAGMKIANDDFLNNTGGFAGIGSTLAGYDQPGRFTFGVNAGMMYCLSHDNNYMAGSERPAAHQYMLLRAGLPIVYTDGYNVQGGPDFFPKPAYIPFLGQYGQTWVTGPLRVRRDFVRGQQIGRWSTPDFGAWEFRDKSENGSMSDEAGTTLLVMMARNYTSGQQAPGGFATTFPANTVLRNYSSVGGPFLAYVGNDRRIYDFENRNVTVPAGGWFAFAPVVPDQTLAFLGSGSVRPIEVFENGAPAAMMSHRRRDGRNGDPAYAHTVTIPRVRDLTNLRFVARADGSAVNVLMKLDGGVDLNSQMGIGPDTGTRRDNPPGSGPANTQAMDLFMGWEQARFVRRVTEKFAAADTARNIIGSPGAETWETIVGQSSAFVRNNAAAAPNTNTDTLTWLFHSPTASHELDATPQFHPAPQNAAGQAITVTVKAGYAGAAAAQGMALYYTATGTSFPEGSAGTGRGDTQVVVLTKVANGAADGTGTPEWWRGTIPAQPAGTRLRYKIGAWRNSAAPRYPSSRDQVDRKERMETVFECDGVNGTTVPVSIHNNRNAQRTGLAEGFHIVRARAFLERTGQASLFNTWSQTFYVDRQRPAGEVRFPSRDGDTIGGSSYGVVVLTDDQTTEVWYQILDSDPANDDGATGQTNGNGASAWARAQAVAVPGNAAGTAFTREWRFDYRRVPASGSAQIQVRLRERTSSADQGLSDADGWYTTLTRTVNTGYPVNYRIAFPQNDGDVVNAGYVGKCVFDKSIGNGIPDAQLLGEFRVFVASTASGSPDGEVLLPAAALAIQRNETPTQDALAFTLPNLFNGDPDFLHWIRVVHARGDITLTDVRLVRAAPDVRADADGDGLPDYWENANRLDLNNPFGDFGPDGDPDGDGFTNLTEFLFDTSPGDGSAAGAPRISVSAGPAAGTWRLTFPVLASRRYRVEVSNGLSAWSPSGPEIVPSADQPAHEWTSPVLSGDRWFFRVRARVP